MKFIGLFFLLLFNLVLGTSRSLASDADSRLEDLFIWKMCNELDLPLPQEKSFTELLKNLGAKKITLQDQLKSLSLELKIGPANLSQYKAVLSSLNSLQIQEIEKIESMLGKQKTAQYVYLKNELYQRLSHRTQGLVGPSSPLPAPRLVEGK